MKALLVIDHFGSGGAQRQMVELAVGLKRRGHSVEMFTYFPQHRFFREYIDQHAIVVHEVAKSGRLGLGMLKGLARTMRHGHYDVVLSYLKSTNIYAEVARVFGGWPTLVVSERTSRDDDFSWLAALGRRTLHTLANAVVANSQSHADWLGTKWWLRGKTSCIWNGVDLSTFRGSPLVPDGPHSVKLLGVGRVGPEKNVLNLMRGLDVFRQRHGFVPSVSWAGRRDQRPAGIRYNAEIDAFLQAAPQLAESWHWLGERSDVPALLRQHHAFVLPSFYEGLPNVACEALAAARPLLISDVCDHSRLTGEGQRGFLFEPANPDSIATAIERMLYREASAWQTMAADCRRFAESRLGVERMVDDYEALFSRLTAERH